MIKTSSILYQVDFVINLSCLKGGFPNRVSKLIRQLLWVWFYYGNGLRFPVVLLVFIGLVLVLRHSIKNRFKPRQLKGIRENGANFSGTQI